MRERLPHELQLAERIKYGFRTDKDANNAFAVAPPSTSPGATSNATPPFSFFLGWATIVIEVIGGLLILLGAFVPLASLPMIVVLLVAIFTVHLPNGFSSIKLVAYDGSGAHFGQPGYETDLLYLAALLALCFGGAGPFSLDGYVSARRRGAARSSLRLHGSAAADQGGAPDREAKIRLSGN